MKRTVYFYWEKAHKALAAVRERAPSKAPRAPAPPAAAPAADAEATWLSTSGAGEEDPGASVDLLDPGASGLSGDAPPRR